MDSELEKMNGEIEALEKEISRKFKKIAWDRIRKGSSEPWGITPRIGNLKRGKHKIERVKAVRHKRDSGIMWMIRRLARSKFNFCKRAGIPFDLTCDYLLSILPKRRICPVLKMKMNPLGTGLCSLAMVLDRKIPSRGYTIGNVWFISSAANLMKRDVVNPQVFRRLADMLEACQS